MPVKGFKTVTLKKELFDRIDQLAHKTSRSVPDMIAYMVDLVEKKELVPNVESS